MKGARRVTLAARRRCETGEEAEDEGSEGGDAGRYDAAGWFDGRPDYGAVEGPGEVRGR